MQVKNRENIYQKEIEIRNDLNVLIERLQESGLHLI